MIKIYTRKLLKLTILTVCLLILRSGLYHTLLQPMETKLHHGIQTHDEETTKFI